MPTVMVNIGAEKYMLRPPTDLKLIVQYTGTGNLSQNCNGFIMTLPEHILLLLLKNCTVG